MNNEHIFKGKWICADMTVEDRFAPIFKKDFIASKEIKKAEIFICGLGLFELKINGILPDDTVLNPAHSQYSKTVLYRVFDITDLIHNGKNTFTVELGNSFLNETTDVWDWDTASWRSAPKMIADIEIHYADGTSESIITDETWQATLDGPTVANSIYLGETFDARRTDFSWNSAKIADAPAGELKMQNMPPIRRISEMKPKSIKRIGSSCIIEAPEMTTGWASISINAPKDTEIVITYGEKLRDDGFVQKIGKYEGHGGEWWPDAYIQQDCFISNGSPAVFEPKFSYKGFRYIQIDNIQSDFSADD
ncbi:MAG: family 78 glycoside hydrolase catalytic domain, partial [Clostridia bacterium]|nr:family 78 glycoside hydrolase catalytic domain [Clostridia bacterium]